MSKKKQKMAKNEQKRAKNEQNRDLELVKFDKDNLIKQLSEIFKDRHHHISADEFTKKNN